MKSKSAYKPASKKRLVVKSHLLILPRPAPAVKDKVSVLTKGINLVTALGGLLLTGWSYKQKFSSRSR